MLPSYSRLRTYWPLPLALLSGFVIPFSLSPWQANLLSIPALALLFLAVHQARSHRVALLAAYLHGLAMFGLGASWLFDAVRDYGGGAATAWLTCIAASAGFALYPLAGMALARWLGGRVPLAYALCLVYPASYTLADWLRGWLLTGNSWLSPGYATVDNGLGGIAPLAGLHGGTLALTCLAGAILLPIVRPGMARALAALLVLAVVSGLNLTGQAAWTQPNGKPWRVALVQANIPQDKKWDSRYRSGLFEDYRALTAQALDNGATIVVWPETALPVWLDEIEGSYLASVRERFSPAQTLVLGIPTRDTRDGPAGNSVVAYQGSTRQRYDKRHLVPFAEYTPLRRQFGDAFNALGGKAQHFRAGDENQAFFIQGQSVAVAICFEIIFGHEMRREVANATAILTVSDDSWFGDSWAPHQHLQMARFRALESGKPVIRATNTGLSALISAQGVVIADGGLFEQSVTVGDITPHTGATPYVRWGTWPLIGLLSLMLTPALLFRGSEAIQGVGNKERTASGKGTDLPIS